MPECRRRADRPVPEVRIRSQRAARRAQPPKRPLARLTPAGQWHPDCVAVIISSCVPSRDDQSGDGFSLVF
jgi:hypothetical protein